ncbi:MAG: DUF1294 domain-containing protein [Clostridia bacterium]|nr:DUF1294 domain-containing protein [Clostridia bacterium]
MILKAIAVYLAIINVTAFAVCGADKSAAKRGAWRVPEKTLFLLAIIGGSLGLWLGMKVFRHKTKHWYFVVGVPLIFIIQVAACIFIYLKTNGNV